MSARDSFSVYLRALFASEIGYRVTGDGRHVLSITMDTGLCTMDAGLYVRPEADDLPAVIAGLRKLAASASEMADALDGVPPFAPGPGTDGGTGAS